MGKILMHVKVLFLIIFISLSFQVKAQQAEVAFKPNLLESSGSANRSSNYAELRRKAISHFDVYSFNTEEIYAFAKTTGVKHFKLQLKDTEYDLTLWKTDQRAGNYKLRLATENGIIEHPSTETSTYKGYINNDPENRVRMSIRKNFIGGVFSIGDQVYVIEPVKTFDASVSTGNEYVFYNSTDIIQTDNVFCGTETDIVLPGIKDEGITITADTDNAAWVCTEVAMVGDYGFLQKFGSVSNAETALKDVLNYVQWHYDKLEIEYKLVEIFLEETNSSTWGTSTKAATLFNSFASWASSNLTTHDVASFFTTRNICGSSCGVIGYAGALGNLCSSIRYNILEYYSGWGTQNSRHGVNMAHELGHNWNAQHVSGCTECVMTPALNGLNNQWNSSSVNAITSFKSSKASCVESGKCVYDQPPVVAFAADKTDGCGTLTVKFTDQSAYEPSSWSWDFGDGNTSTEQNPSHTYNAPGKYTVTLTATNEYGNNLKTKTEFISVGTGQQYPSANGGPDNTIGAGGNFSDNDIRGLFFDAIDDVVIESFFFYSASSGTRTIEILADASTIDQGGQVSGTPFILKEVLIPAGDTRVEVHLNIPKGNNYFIKIKGTLIDLYRNSAGSNYPYFITDALGNDLIDIIQSNASTDALNYYYYFYDWKVRKAGCDGQATSVYTPETGISIYPNPVNDILNIEFQNDNKINKIELKLYNLIGETVHEEQLMSVTTSEKYRLNLDHLIPGTYILYLNTGGDISSYKIMKE